MNGEVLIVDEHTGRMLAGRRYNEGMHQAIEAKEGVEIKQENQTLATITLQNFFRLYDKLSGMTGTATDRGLRVLPDLQARRGADPHQQADDPGTTRPTSSTRPRTRSSRPSSTTSSSGTRPASRCSSARSACEKSELLSGLLKKRGVTHEVLNAKQHEREATHRRRGRPQGRRHGRHQHGRPRHRHHARRQRRVPRRPRAARPRARPGRDARRTTRRRGPRRSSRSRRRVAAEHDEVTRARRAVRARHRAPRVAADRQPAARPLRPPGRPGRVPLLPLARRRPDAAVQRRRWSRSFLTRFNIPEDVPIESKMVTNAIRSAQTQVEAQNFEIRKNVLKYDEVLNRQRTVIYDERRRVLEGADLHEQIRHMIDDVVEGYVVAATGEGFAEEWDLDQLWSALQDALPGVGHGRRAGGGLRRRPVRADRRTSSPRSSRPTRSTPTTSARSSSAARRCASSSAGSCCPCSTASGASTSTRWTTCRRASACGRWPSATRWSSTSARASTCSPR